MDIHPSSVISPKAIIGRNVKIGPFCTVGDDVKIGDNCELKGHVAIYGHTLIGKNNTFWNFCLLGGDPQHLQANPKKLIIGDNNTFREGCTIHLGSSVGEGTTQIGDNNTMMVNCHVGHDCIVGNHNVLSNNAALGGHVKTGDKATICANSAVLPFRRIGDFAYLGVNSKVDKDVPPYLKVGGPGLKIYGTNYIGLKRDNWSAEDRASVKKIFKIFYRDYSMTQEALDCREIKQLCKSSPLATKFVEFVQASECGIVK